MLNTTTHRVTSLEDAERWADAQTPRYSNLQTEAMVYREDRRRGFIGLDQQGRYPELQPQPAEASSELLADKPEPDWQPFSLGDSFRFWLYVLGAPAVVVGVALVAVFR